MNRTEICKLTIQSIKQHITDPTNLEPHRAPNRFIRKRLLSMYQVIMYLIFSSKASLYANLSAIRRILGTLDFPDVSKQAISKARQFIHPDLFKELFYLSVDQYYSNIKHRKLWHGYHIYAIDGSKFELPNSQSNFDFFGEMFGHPNPNRRFTLALASIVYDVLDDYVIHASLQHYLASERSAAHYHLQVVQSLNIFKDSIVIFDRGYYSEKLFRYCSNQGHLALMRLKASVNLSKKCHGEQLTTLSARHKDESALPIRVIEVVLDDGTKEYLATNVFDPKITSDMFRELYFLRWPIELKYKELKDRLRIEEFNGATPIAIFQEFYINLLLSNLSSLIKNDVDERINREINSKPTNKHRYQANRSHIIGELKSLLPLVLSGSISLEAIDVLSLNAFRKRSQITPGRKYPRSHAHPKGRSHFRNRKVAF